MKRLKYSLVLVLFLMCVAAVSPARGSMPPPKDLHHKIIAVKDTLVLYLGSYTGEFVWWEQSVDLYVWNPVPGAAGDTLVFVPEHPATLYLRARVIAGNCDPFSSATLMLGVYEKSIVTTAPVHDIMAHSVLSGGHVTDDGGLPVTSRGVVWDTDEDPSLEDGQHLGFTLDGSGTGEFVSEVRGLDPATTYYLRAYAVTEAGTGYGGVRSFTTGDGVVTINTLEPGDVTAVGAVSGGQILNDGSSPVTQRGVVWSTSDPPLIDDGYDHAYTADGEGMGEFVSQISGLMPETIYYVRAYAMNAAGTHYGGVYSFETRDGVIIIHTKDISNITSDGAWSGGTILDDGGGPVTAKGVVWSLHTNPSLEESQHEGFTDDGDGPESYSSHIQGLTPHTTYYVRAYATNVAGTAYGEEKSFTTAYGVPEVVTHRVIPVSATEAEVYYEIVYDGGLEVTIRGLVYGPSPDPDFGDQMIIDGSGSGSFVTTIDGLVEGNVYHVRAFAGNDAGESFGESLEFVSGGMSVVTRPVHNVTLTTAQSGGDIALDGGDPILARGLVWHDSGEPDLNHKLGYTDEGTGTGSFESQITRLQQHVLYHVRAYAYNSVDTVYGQTFSFTTSCGLTVYDPRDGNTYATVMVGDQCWMSENLHLVVDDSWCYDNDEDNCRAYGRLYTWDAATTGEPADSRQTGSVQGVCPPGWHLPAKEDWEALSAYVVSQGYPNSNVPSGAGNALKSCRQLDSPLGGACDTGTHPRWDANDTHHGFDAFGFSALPAGNFTGTSFSEQGSIGQWWSSTESSATHAAALRLSVSRGDAQLFNFAKTTAYSVRCIREVTDEPDYHKLELDANPGHAGTVYGAGNFAAGEIAQISAAPEQDWIFLYWTGDTEYAGNPYDAETSVEMPAYSIRLTANFKPYEEFECGKDLTFLYRGEEVTYGTLEKGGLCWMDRNLGAEPMPFLPFQHATGYADERLYGDLFQWGRLDDGHQDRQSATTPGPVGTDVPGHGDFLTTAASPHDWRSPRNDNLWQGEGGINNPCPPGWRLPTQDELDAERMSWQANNLAGAYASALKWSATGYRNNSGDILNAQSWGYVWTSSTTGSNARSLAFAGNVAGIFSFPRASGMSVRCVMDL
ncbi:MAG: FISUMP domain-containing protein [Bacteroidales bacterium]|nr:FISUMP domain-containing protein [Bacteroidales bacterium]